MLIPLNRSLGVPCRYANRHGLITGATGTGKTVTLQTLCEGFSRAGVPVFVADVKGDIAALARSCPVALLDLFGISGAKISTTIASMGADVFSRALELTDIQSGAVDVAFAFAADMRLPLNTLADFRALIARIYDEREAISRVYGLVAPASLGAIQRACLRLTAQGGNAIFGAEPFDVARLFAEREGKGVVSILAAEALLNSPRVYGAFLLHVLGSLYGRMPEVGDMPRPRLVLFFDEAHLLFRDMNPALLSKIEQTVRLVRSKGVGVFFVTQSPEDVPPVIREQLAHRLAHDRSLGIGNARFTTIGHDGTPAAPEVVRIDAPACRLGPLTDEERAALVPVSHAAPAPRMAAPSERGALVALCGVALALALACGLLVARGYGTHLAAFVGVAVLLALLKRR